MERMESFIKWILARDVHPQVLLIAPPYAGSEAASDAYYQHFYEESVKMNAGFGELAAKYGLAFADSSQWEIETAYDGLHFSEAGHRAFAEKMKELLK